MTVKPQLRGAYLLANSLVILALMVIMLGAYTRLSDAGLGCPDWPGCYGRVLAPRSSAEILAPSWQGSSVDVMKAWTEMLHRYFASLLGLLVLILTVLIVKAKAASQALKAAALALLALVIFQGLLGMWTVTLKLWPVIVMAHLLGGMATISLVWWLRLSLKPQPDFKLPNPKTTLQNVAWLTLGLVVLQIFLGGWTSANYAALVCLDFPGCQGKLWPGFDWHAFDIISAGVPGSPGQPLDLLARISIHMAHRLGAAVVAASTILLLAWTYRVYKQKKIQQTIRILLSVLLLQLMLGLINVLAVCPLPVAVAHNGTAALLLLALLTLIHDLRYAKGLPS